MPHRWHRAALALVVGTATLVAASSAWATDVHSAKRDAASFFDARTTVAAKKELRAKAAKLDAAPSAAVDDLRTALGPQGVVSLDPLTSTPRAVGRTDDFLTAPNSNAPASIALDYVAARPGVFGLSSADIAALKLVRDYVSVDGTHHLFFSQAASGIPLFGNGLKANVTADGRLINVLGSPVASLTAPSTSPGISAEAAVARSREDAALSRVPNAAETEPGFTTRPTEFTNGDQASLVLFQDVAGTRLAWKTFVTSDADSLVYVIDAQNGRVLYRRSIVNNANDIHALVWENYPNAPLGGTQQDFNLTTPGWLAAGSTTLTSNNSHTYTDINDNDVADPTEEVAPAANGSYSFPFTVFTSPPNPATNNCSAAFVCSWRSQFPQGSFSWQTNRSQNATQVFYFVNKFHDHLAAAPIGFTEAAGNFQNVNSSGQGKGGDAVNTEPLDGANTLCCAGGLPVGLPDNLHVNNANMGTPPDGQPPRMQMFLFHYSQNPADPFVAANGGDEGDIIYHEYTHGLSNRLVVDADGNSTLGNGQAGAMGEAWSDWYAFDFLNDEGFAPDSPADGDLRVGDYVGHGTDLIRTQPLDCPVGSTSPKCQAGTRPGRGSGPGGYTYGDYGKIRTGNVPEVHADGEIWGETLWDLRKALGSDVTESIVTRAMELSPANPSFLDMRNSILQADLVGSGGSHTAAIWSVFAHRGMGWFAGSVDGDDAQPVESFALPPAAGTPFGKLLGKVVDQDTGKPIEGILVGFGGHSSGFPGDYADLTKKNGQYDIKRVSVGTYPKVFAFGAGYDRAVLSTVTITADDATRVDWKLRRDWASIFGGAEVAAFTGPDYTDFGCGPDKAIDQTLGNGWGSDSVNMTTGAHITPSVTIKLPVTVNVVEFGIDPANTCGDDATASTKDYRVETSPDGTNWTVAREGTFGDADRGRLNLVQPTAGATGVQFVRFTMLSQQLAVACPAFPAANQSGCIFADMSEIEVYGTPAG
jgi:extracellular elastinolytic metalloproteinase